MTSRRFTPVVDVLTYHVSLPKYSCICCECSITTFTSFFAQDVTYISYNGEYVYNFVLFIVRDNRYLYCGYIYINFFLDPLCGVYLPCPLLRSWPLYCPCRWKIHHKIENIYSIELHLSYLYLLPVYLPTHVPPNRVSEVRDEERPRYCDPFNKLEGLGPRGVDVLP